MRDKRTARKHAAPQVVTNVQSRSTGQAGPTRVKFAGTSCRNGVRSFDAVVTADQPRPLRSSNAISDDAPARRERPDQLEPEPGVHREDGRLHSGLVRARHPDHGRGRPPVRKGRAGPQDHARVRKTKGAGTTATDGPFTESKEIIGGFGLINAKDKAEAVELARQYADLFDNVEVEVRQIVEFDEVPQA
ncbi:YciI family protein [Amycolatopsis pithecellobii]|uniref:YciI family protein n=1 Tax=Amycolatopsis pithecellobii TaxID=664692 RepID=UPI0035E43F8C